MAPQRGRFIIAGREVGHGRIGKYGKVFISKIGEEEPVFILRAQDQLAAQAIEWYRELAAKNGLPLAESLQKEIEAFGRWGGPKRMPD